MRLYQEDEASICYINKSHGYFIFNIASEKAWRWNSSTYRVVDVKCHRKQTNLTRTRSYTGRRTSLVLFGITRMKPVTSIPERDSTERFILPVHIWRSCRICQHRTSVPDWKCDPSFLTLGRVNNGPTDGAKCWSIFPSGWYWRFSRAFRLCPELESILQTWKNPLEGVPRPKPREPPSDGQVSTSCVEDLVWMYEHVICVLRCICVWEIL